MRYYEIIAEVQSSQEHWEVLTINKRQVKVGWQIAKDNLNQQRHGGLSLRDGISVVVNPLNKSDIHYQNGEERERIIGFPSNNIVLVVITQWVDSVDMPAIRIISVRKAEPREIRKMQMEEDAKPKPSNIDPENPPLTGDEKWAKWGDRVNAKIKAHDDRIKKPNMSGRNK